MSPLPDYIYLSSQTAAMPAGMTAQDAYRRMTQHPPLWLQLAFSLRDRLCALVGLRRIGGFGALGPLRVGSPAHFFIVKVLSDENMRISARDRHPHVRAELTRCGPQQVELVTSVVTSNLVGRLYMLPVVLTHPLVCRALLRRVGAA